jgi:hypothetical protein
MINPRYHYLVLLILFPLSFFLKVVSENLGLLPRDTRTVFLLKYVGVCLLIMTASGWVFKDRYKSFLFGFFLLCIYFLFSPFKDFIGGLSLPPLIKSYSFLLPLITISAFAVGYFLKRTKRPLRSVAGWLAAFLLINFMLETGVTVYKIVSGEKNKVDFGDRKQSLLQGIRLDPKQKPDVVWVIFDAYSSSSTLQKVWNYSNPMDSMLVSKGFYVADSAISNYNYTPYSITSTLDMTYLKDFVHHSTVTAKDIARGMVSVKQNNVFSVFEQLGYNIYNYSIYDVSGHPTEGLRYFEYIPRETFSYRTMDGRIAHDIGWNFTNMFSGKYASADEKRIIELHASYIGLNEKIMKTIRNQKPEGPGFYVFHMPIPHEPYLYDSSGKPSPKQAMEGTREGYLNQLKYSNQLMERLVDSILSGFRNRQFALVLQSDHGFKFNESDPEFDAESCKILYAIYCSDKDYSGWYETMSSVNGFRILFNKYFQTQFPLLRDSSFTLLYRQDKN